jgi:ABC-2 type transport system permease protein
MKMFAIMRRDLRRLARNPITLISTVLMPIIYLVIIGNAFQGQLKHLPLAVVVSDHGRPARRVVQNLLALESGPRTVTLGFFSSPSDAIGEVRSGRYKAALIIPAGFSRDAATGKVAELGLFTDNVDAISAETIEAVLQGATQAIRTRFVSAREPKLDRIVLRPTDLFPKVDYDRSLIPGVIVMAIFMGSLMAGVFNWVMDKFMGVTEAYLVTPLSRWDIAGGILASGVLITSIGAIIVLCLGLLITGGTIEGGLPAFIVLVALIVITATGLLAMSFAMLGRASHPRLVGTFSGFLNVILFFPSGAIYPVESFPPWLREFARFNPETHAVWAMKSVLFKGADFAAIADNLAFLVGFMVAMLVLASVSFKRTL